MHRQLLLFLPKLPRVEKLRLLLVTHDVNPLLSIIDRVVYIANRHCAIGKPEDVINK